MHDGNIPFDKAYLFAFLYGRPAPTNGERWEGASIDSLTMDEYTNGIDFDKLKSADWNKGGRSFQEYVIFENPPERWVYSGGCVCDEPALEGQLHEIHHCGQAAMNVFSPEGNFLCKVCNVCGTKFVATKVS